MSFSCICRRSAHSILLITLGLGIPALAQSISSPSLLVDVYASGRTPQGIDTVQLLDPDDGLNINRSLLAVANTGESSVSLYSLEQDHETLLHSLDHLRTIEGIPHPYAVAACDPALDTKVLITSPIENLLTVVEVPSGVVLGTVQTGSSPYAVQCDFESFNDRRAVVSLANDTLLIIDLNSLSVLTTIPDIPASPHWHGITMVDRTAWVASQERNSITLVDLATFQRVAEVPVEWPLSVVCCHYYDGHSPHVLVSTYTQRGLVEFDARTLQPRLSLPEVPYPLDAAVSSLGVGVPGHDSVLVFGPEETPVLSADGLAEAVGIAGWNRFDPVLRNSEQPVTASRFQRKDAFRGCYRSGRP